MIACDNRCTATSWKGSGPAPAKNQCTRYADHTTYHVDEHGNRWNDDGNLRLIRNANRPSNLRPVR